MRLGIFAWFFFVDMKRYSVTFSPQGKQIFVHEGVTVLEAAGLAGVILNSVCAGAGTCGKCTVRIEPHGLEVVACSWLIEGDITVVVPQQAPLFAKRVLEEGIQLQGDISCDIAAKYPSRTAKQIFGISLDIGTTTVVAKLLDLKDGRCLATASGVNPQMAFGDDVISRISNAGTEKGFTKLHDMIISYVNSLITELCKDAEIDADDIYEISVAGNTAMNHLFLALPVKQLGEAPYEAYSLQAFDKTPAQMSLNINSAGNVHVMENIAGFVGSDTTAVALAVSFDKIDKITLMVDIGTNGELLLGTKDDLYAASCAAGPALEGARIGQGSRAVAGAIESVRFDDKDVYVDVIGEEPAISICGSGLIDAVAVMLDLEIIDSTGRFAEKSALEQKLSPAIINRLIEKDGHPGFVLAWGDDKRKDLVISQRDIRQMQLAKGAIRTGIVILQKELGIEDKDIEQVFLAGAFGNYISRESALRIGMLPDIPCEKIHFIGNAASTGAQMALLSSEMRNLAADITGNIKYIEIAMAKDFQNTFADSMLFPKK